MFLKIITQKEEISEAILSENPVKVRLLRKQTDWTGSSWWEGNLLHGKTLTRVPLYNFDTDSLQPGQVIDIYHARIHHRKTDDSQRISISKMEDSYLAIDAEKSGFSPEIILGGIRESIRDIFLNDNNLREGFIACGLFLGEKKMIPEPIKNRINSVGISHLFAVSGLHVGFIVLLLSTVLKRTGISPGFQGILITLFAFFYAFLTPFSSSVFRTVLMLLIFSVSRQMNQKVHILQIVFLSAVVMLILEPSQVSMVGFWFSYLAVIGILVIYPVISRKFLANGNRIIRYIRDMVLVSFSATWGIMPAGVLVFGTFSSMAILFNILMIPLVFVMLAVLIAKLFLVHFLVTGMLITGVYNGLSRIFFTILDCLAPYAHFLVCYVRNVPLHLGLWLAGTLWIIKYPQKRIYTLWLSTVIILFSFFFLRQSGLPVILSGADNSLLIPDGRKCLMINGTNMEGFEENVLKKFRLYGIYPKYLVLTEETFVNTKHILLLKKHYSGLMVLSPEPHIGQADVIIRSDTTFQFKDRWVGLYPRNGKLNVRIAFNDCQVGIMEYAEREEETDLILSRKKYSEMRIGTDKFLVVRTKNGKECIKERLTEMNLKDGFEIW